MKQSEVRGPSLYDQGLAVAPSLWKGPHSPHYTIATALSLSLRALVAFPFSIPLSQWLVRIPTVTSPGETLPSFVGFP